MAAESIPSDQYRFSVAQFNGLAESGVIPMDTSVELIDGVIFEMQPLGPYHCSISQQIADLLTYTIDADHLVRVEKPIVLGDFSEPVPDIAVVAKRDGDPFFARAHPDSSETKLIIEISDSSYLKDRNVKLENYARAGVSEVWIVNIQRKDIETYQSPNRETGRYATEGVVDQTIPIERESFLIDLSSIVF